MAMVHDTMHGAASLHTTPCNEKQKYDRTRDYADDYSVLQCKNYVF